jgi:hypothetical protein
LYAGICRPGYQPVSRVRIGKREKRPDRALTKPNSQTPEIDPHLARLVAAWPTLPEHIRGAILALVDTAKGSFATQ